MRKGFTLVELLGVIAIIAVLMVMVTPAVLSIARRNKENMYCKKIKTVIKAAQLYGEDSFDYIDKTKAGVTKYLMDGNKQCAIGGTTIAHCQITTISTLADRGYINLEKVGKSSIETEFLDPRNFSSMLSDKVVVYIVNKRVNAQFIYRTKEDGSKCTDAFKVANEKYKSFYYQNGSSISAG